METGIVGVAGTGVFDQDTTGTAAFESLIIGDASGSDGTYNLNAGTMTLSVASAELIIGNAAGSDGTLNVNAGALNITGADVDFTVGGAGAGVLNIDGGSITMQTTTTVTIGGQDGGVGIVNFDSGTLGTTGADFQVNIGDEAGSTGTFNHNGPDITEGRFYVGVTGTGYFNQNGTDVNVWVLTVGEKEGGVGTYTMTSGSDLIVDNSLAVGNEGQGTFNQTNATVQANYVYVGLNNDQYGNHNGQGVYNMTGGTLDVTNNLLVGRHKTALTDAVFNQVGGVVTVGGDMSVGFYDAGGLANEYSGSGTYNLTNGGTVHITGALKVGGTPEEIGETPEDPLFGGIVNTSGTDASDGILNIGDGSYIYAFEGVEVAENSYIADGTTCSSSMIETLNGFQNLSTMNTDFDMTHTTLYLAWGGMGWNPNGGEDGWGGWELMGINMGDVVDMGDNLAGLHNNFALGNLILGGTTVDSIWYQLESNIYCWGFVLEDGAILDLNGYSIYYMPPGSSHNGCAPATLYGDSDFIIDSVGGGVVEALLVENIVPEPGTIVLIGTGILGLAAVLRKKLY